MATRQHQSMRPRQEQSAEERRRHTVRRKESATAYHLHRLLKNTFAAEVTMYGEELAAGDRPVAPSCGWQSVK